MNFPKFAGKSYDFILFHGSEQNTVIQGIIPYDGRFTLSIPKEYLPYIGMSRWLITGTKEGGGIDIFIPGSDFAVSCLYSESNEKNIIYVNNSGNAELNRIYNQQERILSRYQAMLLATKSYDISSSNYSLFKSELEKQKREYMFFQENLRKKNDYISQFLLILNIPRGMGGVLTDLEYQKGKDISQYISHNLDWDSLYTSGYWSEVIDAFVNIHTKVLRDKSRFIKEFELISSKLKEKGLYADFISRLNYFLKN